MNDSTQLDSHGPISPEEMASALFAQLVLERSSLAAMLLGKTPHPQTGETVRDLDSARMIIDQLEMIEAKTKGNLDKDEERLLKQTLMSLRLAFVEAVETPTAAPAQQAGTATPSPTTGAGSKPEAPASSPPPQEDQDAKVRYSKKY